MILGYNFLMNYIIVLSTINNFEKGKEISAKLIEQNLIACSNLIPKVTSVYRWEEKIVEDEEYLIIMKSRSDKFEQIKSEIAKIHPYSIPEIISVNIEQGSKSYLDWIDEVLGR